MKLSKAMIDVVDENIAPPMRYAITIPVIGVTGVTIYVARDPSRPNSEIGPEQLIKIAEALTLR